MSVRSTTDRSPAVADIANAPRSIPETATRLRDTIRAWLDTPRGRVVRDAAEIWLFTRLLFIALTFLVPVMLRPAGKLPSLSDAIHTWGYQDAGHYAAIAQQGYAVGLWRAPFFPLLPLLEHIVAIPLGGNVLLAGLLITNAAYFGALVALRSLAEREFGAEAGRRACLYLSIYPTAFYLFAPFSESLFLLLAVTVFAALRARRWWLAGAVGFVAGLSRQNGLLLVVPFAIEFFQALQAHQARWWQALWGLCIPLALGLYSAYLYLISGDVLAFAHGESVWGRHLQPPWAAIITSFAGLFQRTGAHSGGVPHDWYNLASLLLFLALTVLAFRVVPLSYSLFSVALLAFMTFFPVDEPTAALQGEGRLVLMMFPAFMALGVWNKRPRLHEALLVGMTALLIVATAHYLLDLAGG